MIKKANLKRFAFLLLFSKHEMQRLYIMVNKLRCIDTNIIENMTCRMKK